MLAAAPAPAVAPEPPPSRLIGQKLVVRMDGRAPSAELLGRIRRGEVGGVILFRFNLGSAAQLKALTATLQRAAVAGGQPKLLIAVDQEGGSVTTVPWAPPAVSARRLGERGSAATARAMGRLTGSALRRLGINTDLAPVVDVPATTASFMYAQARTWSFSPATTARLAGAFASGLGDRRVLATAKHFPGIGFATRNTDKEVVRIAAGQNRLAPGLVPFRRAIAAGIPLIMLSNAVYDAYDPRNGAGWSRAVATALLRRELGFRGVSITDSLDGAAHARGVPADALAVRAAAAGADLILLTGSEAASRSVYFSLVRAVAEGRIGRGSLLASNERIAALKRRL